MRCPSCNGDGVILCHDNNAQEDYEEICRYCDGDGEVPEESE